MSVMWKKARTREGFTLVEVMMAIAVLTVGALGILSLQRAAINGNSNARQMTTATTVTRSWIERVRRDALGWQNNAMSGVRTTEYLVSLPEGPGTSGWVTPPVSALTGASPASDWYGNEVATIADGRFCTNLQLTWVVPGELVRVDVRTWWPKRGAFDDRFAGCAVGREIAVTNELEAADVPSLHAVYASTTVRWMGPTL